MSKDKKEKKVEVKLVTPVGTAKFPYLEKGKPDTFEGSSKYCVKLLLSPDQEGVAELQQKIDEVTEEAMAELRATLKPAELKKLDSGKLQLVSYSPLTQEEDRETGELTGLLEFNATRKAFVGKENTHIWPKFFRAKGISPEVKTAWGGDKIQVSGVLSPFVMAMGAGMYRVGASFRLDAYNLVELGDRSGQDDSYGFGDAELVAEAEIGETYAEASAEEADF